MWPTFWAVSVPLFLVALCSQPIALLQSSFLKVESELQLVDFARLHRLAERSLPLRVQSASPDLQDDLVILSNNYARLPSASSPESHPSSTEKWLLANPADAENLVERIVLGVIQPASLSSKEILTEAEAFIVQQQLEVSILTYDPSTWNGSPDLLLSHLRRRLRRHAACAQDLHCKAVFVSFSPHNLTVRFSSSEAMLSSVDDAVQVGRSLGAWLRQISFPPTIVKAAEDFLTPADSTDLSNAVLGDAVQGLLRTRAVSGLEKIARQLPRREHIIAVLLRQPYGGKLASLLRRARGEWEELQLELEREQGASGVKTGDDETCSLPIEGLHAAECSALQRHVEAVGQAQRVIAAVRALESTLVDVTHEVNSALDTARDVFWTVVLKWQHWFIVYGPYWIPMAIPLLRWAKASRAE